VNRGPPPFSWDQIHIYVLLTRARPALQYLATEQHNNSPSARLYSKSSRGVVPCARPTHPFSTIICSPSLSASFCADAKPVCTRHPSTATRGSRSSWVPYITGKSSAGGTLYLHLCGLRVDDHFPQSDNLDHLDSKSGRGGLFISKKLGSLFGQSCFWVR
jgi:hypothetical protein